MASITNRVLKILKAGNLARVVVKCTVKFTPLELCMMKACPDQKMFKLKCQLWGADISVGEWWFGGDDFLFTYNTVHYFPDPTPNASEPRSFDVTVAEGILDEDTGTDEIYGKITLINLFTGGVIKKKTNTVSDSF